VAIYVNKNKGFQQDEPIARECPHCGAHAQLLPIATPSYEALAAARPAHVGIAFRCAACNEPRFLRAVVRNIEGERVELANLAEIERARERFQYGYLPATTERLLRETFECYTAACYNAFASMSRRSVQSGQAALPSLGRERWIAAVRDVLAIAEIDAETARTLEAVLFEQGEPPEIGATEAAILIEVLKDLFYQVYVRTAKLQAALKMRRFFAGEARKITSIDRRRETQVSG
jgi:hypothetical protein